MTTNAKEIEEDFRNALIYTEGRTRTGDARLYLEACQRAYPFCYACRKFDKMDVVWGKHSQFIYFVKIGPDIILSRSPEKLAYASAQMGLFRRSKNNWKPDKKMDTLESFYRIGEFIEEFIEEWKEFKAGD